MRTIAEIFKKLEKTRIKKKKSSLVKLKIKIK